MPHDMLTPAHDESLALRACDIFRRRTQLIGAVFAIVLASAVPFALYLPALYRATAVVLVERPVPESFVRSAVTGELEGRLHVIKQEILSRTRLTELITRFNLYPNLRQRYPLETALDQMRHDMEIELTGPEQVSGRKTTVAFKLSYTGASGATVADVTNALAAFYVEQNDSIRSNEATRTAEFLKAQLAATKTQLEQREHEISAYTSRHQGELPQQVEVNLAALDRLNTQLRLNGERQLKVLEDREKLADGSASAAADPPGGLQAAMMAPRSERLEQMKRDLQVLQGQFTGRYPDVVRLKTEIAALEREQQDAMGHDGEKVNSEAVSRPEPRQPAGAAAGAPVPGTARRKTLEGLGQELDRLKAEEVSLRVSISKFEQRLEGVPEREQEFGRIARDYQGSKDLYDSLLKRYAEAQVGESMEADRQGEHFRILEPALPPSSPVAPNRMRLLVVMVMLAIAAGVGAAILVEQLDPTFHSGDAIRDFTTVPVLATIPDITPAANSTLRLVLTTASVLALIALVAAASAHVARGNEQIVWMLARGA